ncbi:CBY1-interacting BAR domain-containing protein 2-like [Synchiropus picturatus]
MNTHLSRDAQVKNLEQTVKHTEKHLGELCSLLASYTRKTAKLRDKGDRLVAQIFDFAKQEDPELQLGLRNLAEDLAMVQDYRQAEVERLESRVVAPLKTYGDIVKNKKAELKKFNTDLSKEVKELQKLEKLRLQNPSDRRTISQAEVSAQKASNNAQLSSRQLQEAVLDFQRQKVQDVTRVFTDFITVEMLFHAKALEVYTHAYHNLLEVNTQRSLELFSSRLQLFTPADGPQDVSQDSPSRSAPASTQHRTHRRHAHNQGRTSRNTLQRQRGLEEEEDDEEEVDEEQDEVYESEEEETQETL